jgi:hypothetical protein
MITFPAYQTYNYLPKTYRLLWHQTLDEVLRYPELPRECLNFDQYPIFTPLIASQRTLGSNVDTRFERVISDCIISEIWPADDLSMRTGFYYALMRFFTEPLAEGDKLVWYPKDRTWRAFNINIISLSCGDATNQSVNPVHSRPKKDYRWLKSEVKMEFRVLKLVDTPEIITYLQGV